MSGGLSLLLKDNGIGMLEDGVQQLAICLSVGQAYVIYLTALPASTKYKSKTMLMGVQISHSSGRKIIICRLPRAEQPKIKIWLKTPVINKGIEINNINKE